MDLNAPWVADGLFNLNYQETMTNLLEIYVDMSVLTFVSIMLATVLRNREWTLEGILQAMGNRESTPERTALAGRADRAAENTKEFFILFTALAFAAHASGAAEQARLGAEIFFWARLVYLPVYLIGIVYLRTVVWGVGVAGLAMMLRAVL